MLSSVKHLVCVACSVDWEKGLDEGILQEVEGYIIKGKDGQEGVTGEGSLLREPPTMIPQKKSTGEL